MSGLSSDIPSVFGSKKISSSLLLTNSSFMAISLSKTPLILVIDVFIADKIDAFFSDSVAVSAIFCWSGPKWNWAYSPVQAKAILKVLSLPSFVFCWKPAVEKSFLLFDVTIHLKSSSAFGKLLLL